MGIGEDEEVAGNGTLALSADGQASGSVALIGYDYGTGLGTVDGAGSELQGTSGLAVGDDYGTGTIHLTNGGEASAVFYAVIGYNNGAGAATVDGKGSEFSTGGLLYDGYFDGTGSLTVSDGAAVQSAGAIVGGAGGNGSLILSGAGSSWTSSASAYVGGDSSGNLGEGAVTVNAGARSRSSVR